MDAGSLLSFAWRWAPRLPESWVRGALAAVADITWLLQGRGVRRLQENLTRVRPGIGKTELRRLSKAGMRSYFRYYAEVLVQPGLSAVQEDARVRTINDEWAHEALASGRTVVGALGHLGNWDLAGSWAQRNLAPVVTVAERLEPERVFQDFLALRERAGVRILPLSKGNGSQVFRDLTAVARQGGHIVPLLADRDLSAAGIEVDFFGERARVAPGPAALASGGRADLCAISLTYERLRGERRRRAGAPWGIVIEFSDPIRVDSDIVGRERIHAGTQLWVDWLAAAIEKAPQDWHMLQNVFVADLNPAVDTKVRAGDT